MTEHIELAKVYLSLASESKDPSVSLSFLLKSIEEIALEELVSSGVENQYSPETVEKMLNHIRSSRLYKDYKETLRLMADYILGYEVNFDEILANVKKYLDNFRR